MNLYLFSTCDHPAATDVLNVLSASDIRLAYCIGLHEYCGFDAADVSRIRKCEGSLFDLVDYFVFYVCRHSHQDLFFLLARAMIKRVPTLCLFEEQGSYFDMIELYRGNSTSQKNLLLKKYSSEEVDKDIAQFLHPLSINSV